MFKALKDVIKKKQVFNRTQKELYSLSDKELADIGLHRSEIGRIAYETVFGGKSC